MGSPNGCSQQNNGGKEISVDVCFAENAKRFLGSQFSPRTSPSKVVVTIFKTTKVKLSYFPERNVRDVDWPCPKKQSQRSLPEIIKLIPPVHINATDAFSSSIPSADATTSSPTSKHSNQPNQSTPKVRLTYCWGSFLGCSRCLLGVLFTAAINVDFSFFNSFNRSPVSLQEDDNCDWIIGAE